MSSVILKGYNKLTSEGTNNELSIVTPSPVPFNNTKIKRWWRKIYNSTTYAGCAIIDYENVYVVVSCSTDVELKITADSSGIEFDVGFNKLGDGNVNRILVVPKEELYNPINYEDYFYDYKSKLFAKTVNGAGSGIGLFGNVTLDFDFAKNLSLTDQVSGNNLITFSRATTGTYVGSDGLIKTAAANEPRFDHDPVTGESLGLLIEEERTNKILRSENLANATNYWRTQDNATSTLSNVKAPDGTSYMWLVDLSARPGTSSQGSRVYQSQLAFNNVVNTFSFYARSVSGTGTFPVGFYDGTEYVKSYVTLTEETKRYETRSPNSIGTASVNICGFTRRGLTHDETLTQAYIWGCQIEESLFASSYIPTLESTVTRSPDLTTIEGTNFTGGWYNQSEGTIFSYVSPLDADSGRAYLFSNGSNNQRFGQNADSTTGFALFMSRGGNTTSLSAAASGMPKPIKTCLAYQSGSSRGVIDGDLKTLSTRNNTPNAINQVGIGFQNYEGIPAFLNGHIKRFSYFPTRKADSDLVKITS